MSDNNPSEGVYEHAFHKEGVQVLSAAARTTTGTTNGVAADGLISGYGAFRTAEFQLNVTAGATEAGDTLDVTIQTTTDGTNWIDVIHFTQVAGNAAVKRFVAKINATEPQAMIEVGSALAAGSIRNFTGDQYRVSWAIVDVATLTNQSFTFGVTANFLS